MVTAERYDIDSERISEDKVILSHKEAADLLEVSPQAIHARVKAGTIPFVNVPHLGRRVYAPKFQEWCDLQHDLIIIQSRIVEITKDLDEKEVDISNAIKDLVKHDWTPDMLSRYEEIN